MSRTLGRYQAWFDKYAEACARPWHSVPAGIDSTWLHTVVIDHYTAKTLGPEGPSKDEYTLLTSFDPPDTSESLPLIPFLGQPVRVYGRLDGPKLNTQRSRPKTMPQP